MSRELDIRGDNGEAIRNTTSDYLLCGPAGTGKTVSNLFKIRFLAEEYAGARILMVRKTRASLTETGLVTWERDVLGLRHKILTSRPVLRRVRQDYQFANGSCLVVCGMDNPEKALSSEWDLIYFLEATDFSLDDYETLSGRLRSGMTAAVPFQQIIADCNPTRPTHWLYHKINSLDEHGKPRIYFVPNSRYHRADESLAQTGKPTCVVEELAGYVWDTKDIDKKAAKELPIKLNDHGCDQLRYACCYMERAGAGQFSSTGEYSDTVHGDLRNQTW